MKLSTALVAAVLVSGLPAAAAPQRQIPSHQPPWLLPAPVPGDPAPIFRAKDFHGKEVEFGWDDVGASIVHFWAVECEPCRADMTALQSLRESPEAKRLRIVGVKMDVVRVERAMKFVEETGAKYPMYQGDSFVYSSWGGISLVPMTYLVSHEGKILRRYTGSSAATTAAIRFDALAALEGKPLGPLPDTGEAEETNPEGDAARRP